MPTIYLLSGNGSIKAWWKHTIPYFKDKDPVPLELPGFGDNKSDQFEDLQQLAKALIDLTKPGQEIFAVGVNGLVVLHALVLKPEHFSNVILLAPVGAFLWERSFVKIMQIRPLRKLIHSLLKNHPRLFRRKFSSQTWSNEQYKSMGEGYRKCRAFQRYFDMVKPYNALDFFDRIEAPVELIWGTRDAVLDVAQAAAWDSILPRADLSIYINHDWGHYPYIDDPEGFANFIEQPRPSFRAHSKAGRLRLAQMAGIKVPAFFTLSNHAEYEAHSRTLDPGKTYALRSSGKREDQIDQSRAGLHTSYIDVAIEDIPDKLDSLFESGLNEVLVQEFIRPTISGVAFVRQISAEIECVEGHLENLLQGKSQGVRFILTHMGQDWEESPGSEIQSLFSKYQLSFHHLHRFLKKCIKVFHYQHADIEWAWDGKTLYLLQFRPVTAYNWRRCITSANLDEILPKRVSRLMEHIQRHASPHIGKVMGIWDPRIYNDNEPFTALYENASYINSDLWLARFQDWGLPSLIYAQEIGGDVPRIPFRLGKFLINIPVFLSMTWRSRRHMLGIERQLKVFEEEFHVIISHKTDLSSKIEDLVRWMERYYLFIVRSNIIINTAISSTLGTFLGKINSVYRDLDQSPNPHRIPYESDPGTPRQTVKVDDMKPFPEWTEFIGFMHRIGAPGLVNKYIEVREWFRDNNMRLFHKLHLELQGTSWLDLHDGERKQSGTFWQDGGEVLQQSLSFVIYPGEIEGILVLCQVSIDGYSLLSLTLASWVVNCQLTPFCC